MTAVLLALASSLAWGVADFGAGLASRRRAVVTVLAVSSAASFPVVVALVALRGEPPPGVAPAALAALAAVAGTAGIAAFYRGLAVGSMSVVAPISATGAVLPVVFGIASGERPSVLQGAGVALALAGVLLASREAVDGADADAFGAADPGTAASGEGPRRTSAGVGLALVAAVGFGGFFIGIDAASDADPWWAILAQRGTGLLLVLAAAVIIRPGLRVSGAEGGALAVIGILDMTANLLFALASTYGLVSLVGLLGSLYPVVTVLLARGVLRERLAPAQWAGVGAALVGVAMISAG